MIKRYHKQRGVYIQHSYTVDVYLLFHTWNFVHPHILSITQVSVKYTLGLLQNAHSHNVHPYSLSILSEAAAAVGLWSSEARMVGAVAVLGTDRQHGFIHVNVTPLYIIKACGWKRTGLHLWAVAFLPDGMFSVTGVNQVNCLVEGIWTCIWCRATRYNDQVRLELNRYNLGQHIN